MCAKRWDVCYGSVQSTLQHTPLLLVGERTRSSSQQRSPTCSQSVFATIYVRSTWPIKSTRKQKWQNKSNITYKCNIHDKHFAYILSFVLMWRMCSIYENMEVLLCWLWWHMVIACNCSDLERLICKIYIAYGMSDRKCRYVSLLP